MEILDLILSILTTIGAVAFYMLFGYLNSGEEFQWKKTIKTLVLSAIFGTFIGLSGLAVTPETILMAEGWYGTAFGGMFVVSTDKAVTWILNKIGK